ncbi:CHD3-type chromatin-remodeling factor PICKLE-like [Bidens hawaiensis]|uniref:CHD3-type chromatin-remodeling factor PICKLE-like n=1 Tax=Bidens hawaiensis TaxID=980011 RepID=UPI00404B03F5
MIVQQYLVKWKGLSYLHCTWVPKKEFRKAYMELPHLKTKVNNFRKQIFCNSSEDDFAPIRREYTMADRVLARRQEEGEEKEYFVKWVGLDYDECHWESESDISSFQQQIEKFKLLLSRYQKLRIQESSIRDGIDSARKSKEFQQFEKSPEFLHGGELHPYQLKGLNFLRLSWSKKTHVILEDEMGLGMFSLVF